MYYIANDVTANLKCFGVRGHQRPNFDDFVYFRYAAGAPLFGWHRRYLPATVWQGPFADLRPQ